MRPTSGTKAVTSPIARRGVACLTLAPRNRIRTRSDRADQLAPWGVRGSSAVQARAGPRALNLIDSSGWIEYLCGGVYAEFFADPLESEEPFVVPSLSLYEVFKHVLRHEGREEALRVAESMKSGQIVDLDSSLALQAAELSVEHRLAIADSVILATARAFDAYLWTQDPDFEGLEKVHFKAER